MKHADGLVMAVGVSFKTMIVGSTGSFSDTLSTNICSP